MGVLVSNNPLRRFSVQGWCVEPTDLPAGELKPVTRGGMVSLWTTSAGRSVASPVWPLRTYAS